MRQLAFIFIFLLYEIGLPAQDYNELRIRLKKSYAAGRMNDWEPLMRQLEKNFLSSEDTKWLEELAWAEYGYAAYLLHTKQEEKANKVISSALEHADKLLKLNPGKGCYLALKSSLTAFRIQLRPISAPVLGPRSARLLEKAFEIDANNYRVLTEKGLARLYAPFWAGGNPEEAVVLFSKAAAAIATNREFVKNDWYYLHLMASFGQSLQKTGHHAKAVEVYKEVLSVEPSFQWVKNELLPRAQSDAKNQKSGT